MLSFPEPKAKRRKRILLSTVGIVAVLIAGIVAAAVYSPVLALRTVTVQGTKIVKPDKVQAALAPLQGKPLPQISEEDVRALLKPLVQVKDVTAKALPPSTLQVHVTERVPVALVKQGATFQLVDVDGVQLSTTTDAASVPLPVIDGGSGTLPKDLFHAITAVLGALPADVLARLSNASAASADAVELKLVDGQIDRVGQRGGEGTQGPGPRGSPEGSGRPEESGERLRRQRAAAPRHPVMWGQFAAVRRGGRRGADDRTSRREPPGRPREDLRRPDGPDTGLFDRYSRDTRRRLLNVPGIGNTVTDMSYLT